MRAIVALALAAAWLAAPLAHAQDAGAGTAEPNPEDAAPADEPTEAAPEPASDRPAAADGDAGAAGEAAEDEATGDPTSDPASDPAGDPASEATGDEASDPVGDRASGDPAHEAEPPPRRTPRDQELFNYEQSSGVEALASALTIVGVVVAVAGVAWFVERTSAVDQCLDRETADPPTTGCLNLDEISGQRDGGIVTLVAGLAVGIGAGIAWGLLAAERGRRDPQAAAIRCVGLTCVGRF